jgi:general secretion pathway protein B
MSFILDALKKSESERLSKDSPAFSDVPDSTRQKSASHWIWIIVVLIVINISVLTVIYMKPDRVRDPVTAGPSTESISEPAQAAGIADVVAEAERDQPSVAEATAVPVTRIPAAAAPQSAAPAASIVSTDTSVVTETFATFNDLRAQGVLRLPDLHLDIHVYSSNPEDRFVFVNMSKYKERATLDEGPVVREITPDGVILEYLGTGFLLPRQ